MSKSKTRVTTRFLLYVALTAILLAIPIPAYAGGQPFRLISPFHPKQTSSEEHSINPCTGDEGTQTVTFGGVFQFLQLPDGTFHYTLVQSGTYEFVPYDSSLPSYVGQSAFSTSGNINNLSEAVTVTWNIVATGSDGSTLRFHLTQHSILSAGNVEIITTDVRCG